MGFFDAIKSGFSNYVNFQGRARRSEYWFWQLFYWLVIIAFSIPVGMTAESSNGDVFSGFAGILLILFILATWLPSFAMTVRRLHDSGKSGWLVLLNIIPYIGAIILFIMMLFDSAPEENQYGPNPKDLNGIDKEIFA